VIGPLVLAAIAIAAPARLQVTAQEYSLTLSRPSVKAGLAIVELANYGQDTHDLRVRQLGVKSPRTFGVAALAPGDTGDVQRKLVAGRYALWCSIADHRARGMRATLVVKK
jgi:plastocyanin